MESNGAVRTTVLGGVTEMVAQSKARESTLQDIAGAQKLRSRYNLNGKSSGGAKGLKGASYGGAEEVGKGSRVGVSSTAMKSLSWAGPGIS